jgi:hypothetical protein
MDNEALRRILLAAYIYTSGKLKETKLLEDAAAIRPTVNEPGIVLQCQQVVACIGQLISRNSETTNGPFPDFLPILASCPTTVSFPLNIELPLTE